MKRLQVKIGKEWKYVFCRNERKSTPITTDNRKRAIKGDDDSIAYFRNNFASLNFRIVK